MAKRKIIFKGITNSEIQDSMEIIQKMDYFTDPSFEKLYNFFMSVEAGTEYWRVEIKFFKSIFRMISKEVKPELKHFVKRIKAFMKSKGIFILEDSA